MKVLPFVSLDVAAKNQQIDAEILERERLKALEQIAEDVISDLDVSRLINGDVDG